MVREIHQTRPPTVAVCADDRIGVAGALVRSLRRRGYATRLFGALREDAPDHLNSRASFAAAVTELLTGRVDEAIVCTWCGAGAAIRAMETVGARAAYCTDAETARCVRPLVGCNVLALSLRLTSELVMEEILDVWLSTTATDTGVDTAEHGIEMGPAVLKLLISHGSSELVNVLTTLETYDAIRGTVLSATLQAYCACGFNLTQAAAAVRVHPNTIAYRLDRIRKLTDLDHHNPDDLLVLGLAARHAGGPQWQDRSRHSESNKLTEAT